MESSAASRRDVARPLAAAARAELPAQLRLLRVTPPDGSFIETRAWVELEFDRALDPASLAGAVSLEYVEPRATFLADPFRHVGVRLLPDRATLVIEPPELLVGREVRVRLTSALRGADGSREAQDLPQVLTYRVMELPP